MEVKCCLKIKLLRNFRPAYVVGAKVRKLKKFSAHWLRHLSASMQDRVGIKFTHIKANHRHESGETTRRYVHAIDADRHQDMQKLSLRVPLRGIK